MSKVFPVLLFCVSVFIAGCAAYFSVKGIGLLFAGSFIPVIIMASSLEIGKLFAVSFLYRQWHVMRFLYKLYLTSACGLLILITSLGIFGFLSDAYQDTKTKVDHYGAKIISLESQTSNLHERINTLQTNANSDRDSSTVSIDKYKKIYDDFVTQSNKRSEQLNSKLMELDTALDVVVSKPGGLFSSKNKKISELKAQQENIRDDIASELSLIEAKISKEYEAFLGKVDSLSDNKTDNQNVSVEIDNLYTQIKVNNDQIIQYKSDISQTDIGSFKFIARSFDIPLEEAVKWFIFAIVIVFDPLAICLIIGYNMITINNQQRFTNHKKIKSPGKQKTKTKIVPVHSSPPVDMKMTQTPPGEKRVIQFGKK